MPSKSLVFDILANDKTGRAFDSVKEKLTGSSAAIDRMNTRVRDFGISATKVGGVLTAGITTPLALAAKEMVGLFNDQDRAMTLVRQGVEQTGAAAGFAAEDLFQMASALQEATTFGDENILQNVTAQFLTFGNIAGEQFERAQMAALDLATVLNQDVKSISIQLGKALNDPVKGLSALSRAGIQFTEEQKGVIEALVETGEVAQAQNLILDELSAQYGGQAAAAAQTFSGQTQQLANSWGDVKEQFGEIIAEFLPPLVDGLQDVVAFLGDLNPETKKWGVILAGAAAVLGPLVLSVGLFATAIGAIGVPLAAAIAGVTAITAGIAAFWPEIEKAAAVVQDSFVVALEWLSESASETLTFFEALPERFAEIGRDLISGLVDGMVSRYESAKETILGLPGQIVSGWKNLLGIQSPSKVFQEIGEFIMEGLAIGMDSGLSQATSSVDRFTGTIRDGIGGALTDALTDTRSFSDSMKSILSGLATDLSRSWISEGIGAALGAFGIPGNANGTMNWRGGLTRINERGGEIVNLPSGSQIIPHDVSMARAMRSSSPSSTVNATINITGETTREQKAAAAREMKAMIDQYAPAAVQNYNVRYG